MRCKEDVINSLEICLYPPSKCENCSYYEDEECNDDLCRDALELLKKQPEIVHCKDCKHLFDGENDENCCAVLMEKARWIIPIQVDPNWFCGSGERKTQDG